MSSGGGKSSTPKLLSDNLRSKQFYKVLDLISEGPIYGPVDQSHLSSFMLNKTPVTDSAGNVSVNGVSAAWRPGTETQEVITGFDAVEAATIVNLEVTYDTPLVRTITDTDVTRVRFNVGVSTLVEQDSKGNQHNTTVVMAIETQTGAGAWQIRETVSITGKISGEFLEAHTITAPDTKPFNIRVRRITPDSTSDLLTNNTVWNSFVAITDDKFSYPYSALVGCVVDRDQYTSTPSRTYHMRGLIVDIPDNYDPINRTYTGLWLGGFKQAWTDNPAWLFRALAKNQRYGLARAAGVIDVDDGALYILSQYCDQSVNDGYGGKEPRFRLNAYITEQSSARDILDKIAGMFRGVALWDGMRLSVLIDTPQDAIATITNANVVDGKFSRSSTKRSERYNAVVVSWTDPDNGWEQSKEYVSDDDLIGRFGYNETTTEAFGCTSRGQAWRTGKWLLETAKLESSAITFSMARDAIHFTPGDIVEVVDNNHIGTRLGGRVLSHSDAVITVDSVDSDYIDSSSTLSLMSREGKFVKYNIRSVDGNAITLTTVPAFVIDGSVFAVSVSAVSSRLFRIMSVEETSNNSVYQITASLHNPNKQAIVDEGAVFTAPSDTLNAYRVPNVENLRIINTNSETVQVTATWETATTVHALIFELYVYSEDGNVVAQFETDQFRYEFWGLNAGHYTLGVRGRNDNGMKGAETQVDLIIGAPSAPASVQWVEDFFAAMLIPVMQVTATSDTSFEFWYAGESPVTSNVTDNTQFLGRSTQWRLSNLKADTTYYVYVRTRNAFGASDFIEVSGKASAEIPGMIDYIDQSIRESETFQHLATISETSIEAILQNSMAIDASVEHQWAQYGEIRADVIHITTTIADVEKAFAEYQTIVQAEFDKTIAQVNQKLTASVTSEGVASAFYDLGLQIVRNDIAYKTGMSMGIEPDGSEGYRSTIVFAADQFGIYAGNDPSNWQAAFFVYNGQVFIRSAFIQDASIDFGKITDTLQSINFISGSAGWRLWKNGNAEFNNVTVRGTVYANEGHFNGTIYATDGYFAGTVQAKRFIGDIAVAAPYADITARIGYNVEVPSSSTWSNPRYIYYTPSSTADAMVVTLSCMVSINVRYDPSVAIRMTIGNSSTIRRIRRAHLTSDETGVEFKNSWVHQSFSAEIPAGSSTVTCSIAIATSGSDTSNAPNTYCTSILAMATRANNQGSFT